MSGGTEPILKLPRQGLQGQDLQGHLTWTGLEWDNVELECGDGLRLTAVFNATDIELDTTRRHACIRAVERDGYLGILLGTTPSETSVDRRETLVARFRLRNGETLSYEAAVELFRPEIRIERVPQSIRYAPNGVPSDRLTIRRRGYGTAIVTVVPREESEVRVTLPEQILTAARGFTEDFQRQLGVLRHEYPQYGGFFDLSEEIDFSNKDEALSRLSNEIRDMQFSDMFKEDLASALRLAVLRNTDFELLLIRPVIDFVLSTIGKGIIYTNPFFEVLLSESSQRLAVDFRVTDVLGRSIEVTSTTVLVSGPAGMRVPLASLFDWRGPRDS